jgi:hypothetical protein
MSHIKIPTHKLQAWQLHDVIKKPHNGGMLAVQVDIFIVEDIPP